MSDLIGGLSPQQYHAYLYPAYKREKVPSHSHWLIHFNFIGSPFFLNLINRLAYFFLMRCSAYPDNGYLLARFRAHDFTKINSQAELVVVQTLFKRFLNCGDLRQISSYQHTLDAIEVALKDSESRLTSPSGFGAAGIHQPAGNKVKGRKASGINEAIKKLSIPAISESNEEPIPEDPGKKVPLPPPPPPPPPGGGGRPPPPPSGGPPPPPGGPPPFSGNRGGTPHAGLQTLKQTGGLPQSPTLPQVYFIDEPKEPDFKHNPGKALIDALDKATLEGQIAEIEKYLKGLKKVILPIQDLVEEEEGLKEQYDNELQELNLRKKEFAKKQAIQEKLSEKSEVSSLLFEVSKDSFQEIVLYSDIKYSSTNELLKENGLPPLSRKFCKEDMLEAVEEELVDLKKTIDSHQDSVNTLECELKKIRANVNNGLTFDKFKKALAVKKETQERWERALKVFRKRLDEFSAPPKIVRTLSLGKPKSLADLLESKPELHKSDPTLAKVASLMEHRNVQIVARSDPKVFLKSMKAE